MGTLLLPSPHNQTQSLKSKNAFLSSNRAKSANIVARRFRSRNLDMSDPSVLDIVRRDG